MAKQRRVDAQFENPAPPPPEPAAPTQPAFEDPESPYETDDFDVSASSEIPEITVPLSASDRSVVQLKTAIEAMLVQQAGPRVEGTVLAAQSLSGSGNIQGVGYALGGPSSGAEPGTPTLVVFTAEPASEDEVKGVMANAAAATDEDLYVTPMRVVRTGLIEVFPHRFKERPAPCGISVGHFQITAGTIGALATGRSGDRANRLFVLSNNHVLANVNAGPVGAAILQPGPIDGGQNPRDRIGELERYVPINFNAGAVNYVDCATAWVTSTAVRKEVVYLVNNEPRYFRVGSRVVQPRVEAVVGKSGRTTQLRKGRISAVGVTINVGFGAGRVATFADQFSVVSTVPNEVFSSPGDSGSLIWSWEAARNPMGLLFAGGNGVTFANRLSRVLTALDISLYV